MQGRALLVLGSGTGLHEQIAEALRRRGVLCHLVEYPTAETIKSAVALGIGATILPRSAVQDELRTGTLSGMPIADWPGAERIMRLLVRAEGQLPRHVKAFVSLCVERSLRLLIRSRPYSDWSLK